MPLRLSRFALDRMIRDGEFGRALAHSGRSPSVDLLASLGLFLSVKDLADKHNKSVKDRLAIALADAALGDVASAKRIVGQILGELGDQARVTIAGAIAPWSSELALAWLPADHHHGRCACLAAMGRLSDAAVEIRHARSANKASAAEILALDAILAGRALKPVKAALNALFCAQGLGPTLDENAPGLFDTRAARHDADDKGQSAALVTVLMPARNAAPTIRYAIDSILKQTHRNIELIVIDDSSDDDTAAIATEMLAEDGRGYVLRSGSSPAGPSAARNRGLAHAIGSFVAMQDADDWSHPERLSDAVGKIEASNALALVSRLVRFDEHCAITAPRIFPLIRMNPSSLVLRRNQVVETLGGFDQVKTGADTEYIARLVNRHGPRALIRDRTVSMLVALRTGSLTHQSSSAINDLDGVKQRVAYRETWVRRHCDMISCRDGWRLPVAVHG